MGGSIGQRLWLRYAAVGVRLRRLLWRGGVSRVSGRVAAFAPPAQNLRALLTRDVCADIC